MTSQYYAETIGVHTMRVRVMNVLRQLTKRATAMPTQVNVLGRPEIVMRVNDIPTIAGKGMGEYARTMTESQVLAVARQSEFFRLQKCSWEELWQAYTCTDWGK